MGELKKKIKDLADAAFGPTLEIVSEALLEGATGIIVPGVGNLILSYKQNRMERRIVSVLQTLISRQEEFNEALAKLKAESEVQNIKGKYFEMLMDYAIDEPQEEKIHYLVNGYINVARMSRPQEDVIRNYYDTLKQLNILDIRVLKIFINLDTEQSLVDDIMNDAFQIDIIIEKLVRLGLLYSCKEEKLNDTINEIIDYFHNMISDEDGIVRRPRISLSSGYRLSNYGEQFNKFFGDEL